MAESAQYDAEVIRQALPGLLPAFLQSKRWFAGKSEKIASIGIEDSFSLPAGFIFLIAVAFESSRSQRYALPLAARSSESAVINDPARMIIPASAGRPACALSDALDDSRFAMALLDSIRSGSLVNGENGALAASATNWLKDFADSRSAGWLSQLQPSVMRVEQSNTSVNYGGALMLKFFRRPEEGVNLDFETGRFLTEKAHFAHTPPVAGHIEYRRPGRPPATLALLQGFVKNQGDAWSYTLRSLDQYFSRASANELVVEPPAAPLLSLAASEPPRSAREIIGEYLDSAALLGQRTAELHLALAHDPSDPEFAPEPFASQDRESLSTAMVALAGQSIELLESRLDFLPDLSRHKAKRVLEKRAALLGHCKEIARRPMTAARARIHGDYHLGQVLYTGTDFVIIDFEGEPERPLSARRLKQSPLRDVAGMLRSFSYAAGAALLSLGGDAADSPVEESSLRRLARFWTRWVKARYLRSYLETSRGAAFVPTDPAGLDLLLRLFVMDKALYEIIYELRNRPDWVSIPLDGVLDAL